MKTMRHDQHRAVRGHLEGLCKGVARIGGHSPYRLFDCSAVEKPSASGGTELWEFPVAFHTKQSNQELGLWTSPAMESGLRSIGIQKKIANPGATQTPRLRLVRTEERNSSCGAVSKGCRTSGVARGSGCLMDDA